MTFSRKGWTAVLAVVVIAGAMWYVSLQSQSVVGPSAVTQRVDAFHGLYGYYPLTPLDPAFYSEFVASHGLKIGQITGAHGIYYVTSTQWWTRLRSRGRMRYFQ